MIGDAIVSAARVGAIVHTHSPWATAVSCTRRDMPPFHYMMVGIFKAYGEQAGGATG